jgi:hypothetical protein
MNPPGSWHAAPIIALPSTTHAEWGSEQNSAYLRSGHTDAIGHEIEVTFRVTRQRRVDVLLESAA